MTDSERLVKRYCIVLSYLTLPYLTLSPLTVALCCPISYLIVLNCITSSLNTMSSIVLSHHLPLILFYYILFYDAEPNGIFRPENEWTRQAHLETTGTKSGESIFLTLILTLNLSITRTIKLTPSRTVPLTLSLTLIMTRILILILILTLTRTLTRTRTLLYAVLT